MSFIERLAARRAAETPYKDVTIALDDDLASKRAELEAQLQIVRANADERLAKSNDEEVELQRQLDALIEDAAESLVTFRFRRLPGLEWGEITARCPVRLGVDIDMRYGYNMHAATVMAAPKCGTRLEDDAEVPVTEEQWRDIFATISGYEMTLILDAIYELNEYGPAAQIAALKKVSAIRQSSEQS